VSDIGVPVWFAAWVWLTLLFLDYLFAVMLGPLTLLGVLRLIVVAIGTAAVSFGLFRRRRVVLGA
jgi:hypothetical protein